MHTSDSASDPDRIARYRERVFSERAALRDAARQPAFHQERVLRELLEHNAGTEFGKEHGFASIRSFEEFRRAVPVRDYRGLSPWIEKMAAGARNVLTADDPAVYFTSSGTTGAHKKIPVTPAFMRRTFFPFYYAAWAPLIEHFPEVLTDRDAVLNLKHDPLAAPPTTGSGRPHVGASQVDLGGTFGEPLAAEPGSSATWATLPVPVAADDHLHRMYLRLRLALESDVRCVIGINPAMVAALPYQLRLWWPHLIKEIRDGTLGGVPHGRPNPERAAELERLADHFGTIRPTHVWPRMKAVFCWTTGLASLYLPRLREEFGTGVTVLPAPVAASEGPVGVALDRHGSAGSLVVTASVYEFVEAGTDISEDVETLRPEDLEAGHDYHVVFSHIGGFFRYAVGDVVHVVDRVGGVPRVEYAGRGTRSDVAGERLLEAPVIRALAHAATATGLEPGNAACRVAADPDGGHRYEFAVSDRTPWSPGEGDRFAEALDGELCRQAPGYRTARATGRLGGASVTRLGGDAFRRDWHNTVATGIRPTQVKDRLFRQDPAQWARLTGGTADVTGNEAT